MSKRVVFATGNKDKVKEASKILGQLGVEVIPQSELGIKVDVDENGSSFAENALIKARAVASVCNEIVIADDSGLVVDYINGEPGIYSARYMGEVTSYTIKNANIIERLKDAVEQERSARFVAAIACVLPDGREFTALGTMEGFIAYEPAGDNGFGYDPILFLKDYNMTSAELSMEEKNKISHRGKALRAMCEILKEQGLGE